MMRAADDPCGVSGVRSFIVAVAIVTTAMFASPRPLVADDQDLKPPVWNNRLDPAHGTSTLVTSQVGTETGDRPDCDQKTATDDDKTDSDTSADDDSKEQSQATDSTPDDNEKAPRQNENAAPKQETAEAASPQRGDDGCDERDADAADTDDQDADTSSTNETPDDQQRTHQETKVDVYRDSDGYRTGTVTTDNHLVFDNFFLDLTRDSVFASDFAGSERSEDTMISFFAQLNEQFGVGGGFGSVYSRGWSLPVGSLKTTANLADATIETGVSRSLLATTAQTIRNRVMQTDASANISYEITKNFVPSLEFHHINYSDHNRSIGVDFTPQYTFHFDASQLQLGYEFSYQSFAKNPDNGYWAPQKALSNGISGTWSFDRTAYYGRAELGVRYDSVRASGNLADGPSSGPGGSAEFAFGIRPTNETTLETYWTGDGSPGWSSMNFGISLKYFFEP
jgi:hypothetical protein